MNRDQFVRLATITLRQRGVLQAEEHVEAIASAMDLLAAVLGDVPAGALTPAPAPTMPRPAFPSPNPEAVVDPYLEQYNPPPKPLVIPATSITDQDIAEARKLQNELAPAAAPPLRSIRPATRLKVEDLSKMIQDRTPAMVSFDVPMENGAMARQSWVRDVISMHAFDSVRVVLYPPNTSKSAQESLQVQEVVHVDDVPMDLSAMMRRLVEQAVASARPRRIPQSVMPAATSGPVKHQSDTYQDPGIAALTVQTQNVFNSMG